MITLALVGVGKWGKNIVATLGNLPAVQLKYICARNKESLSPYPDTFVKVTDWKELLRKKDVDGVLIATPPSSHADIATAFLKKGISVFVEKPMTDNLADAKRMAKAVSKNNGILLVGHIHLFNDAYQAAKKTIQSSGPITYIQTQAGGNGPFRNDFSALWDWAPHDIAVILDLLGEEPTTVQAWGVSMLRPGTTLYDVAEVKFTFKSGCMATIRVSWLDPVKHKKVTVFAGDNAVVYDDALSEKKVTLFKNIVPLADTSTEPVSLSRRDPEITYPVYENTRPLENELKAFVDCIVKKTKHISGVGLGLSVIRILDAAERSISRGGKEISL